ncbi:MAG: toll/interleukin-1 receptor domain-containing protein, partial [Chloroflexota bacterium]
MHSPSDFSDVFVSYRRKDAAFTKQLVQVLRDAGKEVWVDWEDIPPGSEAFGDDIRHGLDGADAFLCVLTPDYLESSYCMDMELGHALSYGKKIIPVVLKPFDSSRLPGPVRAINWIYFTPHGGHTNPFEVGMDKVIQAMDQDLEHARAHGRYSRRAIEWDENNRDDSYLLNGSEIEAAEAWMSASPGKTPQPFELQREYVRQSRAFEQEKQAEEMRLQQRAIQRLRLLVALAVLTALVTIGLLVFIVNLQQRIQEQQRVSTESLATAAFEAGNYDRAIAYYTTLIEEFDELAAYDARGAA